ncbi:MAG: glycosyltransferase family 1 protein, partial [Bacteroidota bacterium]
DLANQFPEQAYFLYSPTIRPHPQNQHFLNNPSFSIRQNGYWPKAYWRSWGLKTRLRQDEIQLYHGLSNELPFQMQASGIKTVVTIHDLIFKYFPQQYPWIDRQIYDFKFRHACQRADHIIAISQSTKQDLMKYYQIPETKISVIYQSCSGIYDTLVDKKLIQEMRQRYGLPKDYLLYVGAINERKNLMTLAKALHHLSDNHRIPLVVVGKGGQYERKVRAYVKQMQLDQQVFWLGQARQADLPALYQGAQIFIYPSHYEGFGIPIIEALHSKTPVITAQQSALPEAAGPGAYYIDPSSAEQLATGIAQLLEDSELSQQLVQAGYQHVQQFSNLESSKAVMQVYQQLLGSNFKLTG